MVFKKNKRQNSVVYALAVFVFSSGIFFLIPSSVHAGFLGDLFGDTVGSAFKALLYGVFVMVGWLASMAITLFEWAVNPDYISGPGGLLNRASVYEMWQFVRDFFNLFFILTLLYTAFTIVFQVANNYKKTLLSIVLAALFVNFSFPITRVIIDVTNVPMYYFINQIGAAKDGTIQKEYLGTVLSASQIQNILIPGSKGGVGEVDFTNIGVSQILMAIVFLFIFSITLLVLAVLFVIRVAALIILLIFSSAGFAASVIPGLGKYGSMWWDKLWQYTLFGPAAALMLMIATRFFAEVSKDNTIKQFIDSATANTTPTSAGFISSMAMFTIPIIMLWMAIGLSTSMSIMGGAAISGQGQRFLKGTGKWLGRNNPVSTRAVGAYHGVKKGLHEGKLGGVEYGKMKLPAFLGGKQIGKLATGKYYKESAEATEAAWKGAAYGGKEGRQTEAQILHAKRVNQAVKENKDNQVNRSVLVQNLESNDIVERQAAAMTLAANSEIRTSQDLEQVITALRSNQDKTNPEYNEAAADMIATAIDKAKDGATSNISSATYARIAASAGGYLKDDKQPGGYKRDNNGEKIAGPALEALNAKLKKDGGLNVRINYLIDEKVKSSTDGFGVTIPRATAQKEVYDKMVNTLSAEDLVKQRSLHEEDGFKEYFTEKLKGNYGRIEKILDKAMEKGRPEVQEKWREIARKEKDNDTARKSAQEQTDAKKAETQRLSEKIQARQRANRG